MVKDYLNFDWNLLPLGILKNLASAASINDFLLRKKGILPLQSKLFLSS
jgi:hypothetical protein